MASTLRMTRNGLRVGHVVEYETLEESDDGVTHFIPGTVVEVLSPTRVLLKQRNGTTFEVDAEWCQRVYNCYECHDTGEILVSRAHQAYSKEKGTYIEDDVYEKCKHCSV